MSSRCRFCSEPLTKSFLDLGSTPLANSYVKSVMSINEPLFPLHAYVCTKCLLVQLEEYQSPQEIFSDYAYFSSYSETWLKHAEKYVEHILSRFNLNANSSIIEIASNDGYLLQFFLRKGYAVLGIEPAANVAKVAIDKGIPTITDFFGVKLANKLVSEGKQADLLIGNNVLAHVPDLNDFVCGLDILLKKDGLITIEFPHLLQLITYNQFDTIYHEHFSYFSFHSVLEIFSRHKLRIFDVEEISTHGGSLRIYATHKENSMFVTTPNVHKLLEKEKSEGLTNILTYEKFGSKIIELRNSIRNFLIEQKHSGKKIIGYGAAAKGNTLLNYCNIGKDIIDYVVDRNPHKQNLFLPGTHIPIKSPDIVKETRPDFVVILPWNLKDEVIHQLDFIRNWGGKFITLIPEVKVF